MKPAPAKLTPPRVEGVVERGRLFQRLDGVAGKKIVWIAAPGGSGKTTLIASWLASRKLPCLWYQADESDRDIASFFSYLGQAAKRAAPKRRTALPRLTPEYRLDIPTFTRRWFEELYARLAAAGVPKRVLRPAAAPAASRLTPRGFGLVIDNYQDVPADSQFHEVSRDGLSVAPEGMTVVIVSRVDPPPEFSRLRVTGRLEVIGRKELAFTLEEAKTLLESRGRKIPADNVLGALHKKTGGWAAGLVLMTESEALDGGIPELGVIPSDRIFDYFSTEIFERVNDDLRHFLLLSAFLPEMTVKMAEDMTDNGDSERILSRLNRTNFFTERRATPELTYLYHPLFREFLQNRALETYGRETMQGTRKRAAALLLKAGQTEDAARLLIEIADWQGLSELIQGAAPAFMAEGRFLTVGTWIHEMPAEAVERNGWLLYWKAMCRLVTRPAEARSMLEKAYALFQAGQDAGGAYLAWSGIVETFVYEWRDFKSLDLWITEFDGLIQRYAGFPSKDVEERATSAIFAALIFRQPGNPGLPRRAEQVQDIITNTPDISRRMFIGYNLILYYLWIGRINEAGVLSAMLSPVIRQANIEPLPRLMWLRSQALYYFYSVQSAAGLQAAEQGLRLAEETGVHVLDLILYGVAIYHAVIRGDRGLAQDYLQRMSSALHRGGCFADIHYAAQSSLVYLLQGDVDTAVALAERSVKLAEAAGAPLPLSALKTQRIDVFVEGDRAGGLGGDIASLRRLGEEIKNENIEAWCSNIEAQLALQAGDIPLFAERFSRAVSVCRRTGLRFLAFLPKTLSRLCAQALELGIETDFVKELIRITQLVPDDATLALETWPHPVKLYTLGRFELLLNDEPVASSGRVQQKPLELLKAVIAMGGRDVSEAHLTDALWPESDGDAAKNSFDTTLHRLRKLIGNDKTVVFRDGLLGLDPRYCWVDVWAFEQTLCRIEKDEGQGTGAKGEGERVVVTRLAEKAVALYKGHFLPSDARSSWSPSIRERLKSKFLSLIVRLGRQSMENGDCERAMEWFRKGLEIEDHAEEFYQNLMLCQQRLGQEAEVVKTFYRCRAILHKSLGLEPSTKTREIYSSIRRNG